jgi:hypothetical protein
MKKLFALSFIVLSVVSLSSCKKDYTCTCKDSSGNTVGSITIKSTKSKAKTTCTADNSMYGGTGTTCTLN